MRILIVRLSAIGDVINTLPAFAALRAAWPQAEFGWAVEDRAASLLEGMPGLDRVHRFPRAAMAQSPWYRRPTLLYAYVRELRAARYDAVIDFQGNAKSALQVIWSRARQRWGFVAEHCREHSELTTNRRVRPEPTARNRVEKNLALAVGFGAKPSTEPAQYPVAEGVRREVDALLPAMGMRGVFAVAHPGTSGFGAFKRWPLQHWAEGIRRFHARTGLPTLITWGPGERWMASAIVAGAGAAAIECPRLPGLQHLAAVLRRAVLVVGCDSAALHLAARVGTPTVGLFGPKDPAVYGPWGNRAEILVGDVPCRPCTLRTCGYPECMRRIDAERVAEAMERMLREIGEVR